jgi:hypothetical protein
MNKDEALEKKAENARELGLNYEPDWTKEEDEAFNEVEKQSNLGKQILRANKSSGMDCCTYDCVQGRNCPVRIKALEEVALEIDKLKAFGDTASSFASFVRSFKR